MKRISLALVLLTMLGTAPAQAKSPLKVYILAGQSNMDGHAKARTIAAMKGDPQVTDLYKDMTDANGKPIAVDGVCIVLGTRSGKLDASFWRRTAGAKDWPGICLRYLYARPEGGQERSLMETFEKIRKEPMPELVSIKEHIKTKPEQQFLDWLEERQKKTENMLEKPVK